MITYYRHILHGNVLPFAALKGADIDELAEFLGATVKPKAKSAKDRKIVGAAVTVPSHKKGKAPLPKSGFIVCREDGRGEKTYEHMAEIDADTWVKVEEPEE